MNIGFIFPNKDRRYKTVHLGLGYLAAYAKLQHDNLTFQVLDTRVATSKETRKFFNTHFDIIGITVYSPVYHEVIAIFNKIRKLNSKIPICIGGPYVTTMMEEIFIKTSADFAVYGEGEITFSELIFYLKKERDIKEIKGLMYKSEFGEIIVNPARDYIKEISKLPFPAYEIFPMQRYPLHRMITSRGCPYSCAWCNSSSLWKGSYRKRDLENVITEMELLIKNYGRKIFVFGDNSFNMDLRWVENFCDILINKKIKILWSISLRADILTQEIAYKMAEAGCYNVSIGVESANNVVLKHINKSITIEKITEGIRMVKNAGIEVLSQFVIGSPHDTLETVKESIEYAKKSESDYANFYTVLPYKGTPQWDYVLSNGTFYTTEIHDFHTTKPRIVFETPEFPYKDRLEAIKLATKEGFYSNKDKKSWFFDFAKETSRKIQIFLPATTGKRIYMALKSIYQYKLVKKHNI